MEETARQKSERAYPDDFASLRPGYARSLRIAHRGARIHAFDIEAGISALFVGVRVGFSPGELLDFLLGWFGIDIAGDDTMRPYLEVLEDESASPEEYQEAARRAVARQDRLAVLPLLRGMAEANHVTIAVNAIVALGDVAVEPAITVFENPHADTLIRASAGDALQALLRTGDLSPQKKRDVLAALQEQR
jgi:hypothetical protein